MISQELIKLEAAKKPIRIGVSGAGWIGSGFVQQVSHMHGMTVNVLADADVNAARDTFIAAGISVENIIEVDNVSSASDALRHGKSVVTGDYRLAAQLEDVDIVADVTPYPSTGAETAYSCIQHHKDIVMVNIEADVTVGHILKKLADKEGILYTVSSGDEPGCLSELWEYVNTLGLEPIVIGKGKNNPLNPSATPDTVAESAQKSKKNPYQVASYVDGTKTMFEMTCAANATGCKPMQRGMVGPVADRQTITKLFSLEGDGGIAKYPGVVDFVQGDDMSGGVFITTRVPDHRIAADLEYLKVGKGNYCTFFRPYHLWFVEAPISVAKAFLQHETTLVPLDQPVADSMTIAKRDLSVGETLDQFGGYTFHGSIEIAATARQLNALPVGLAPGAQIIKDVLKGNVITWDDVKLDENQLVVRLRRQQDALFSL